MPDIDLNAYFTRIGYDGSREPTLATLGAIQMGHMSRIPFENLDVLLGRGVRLDLDSLQKKLVAAKRGGYCFEHSTLLGAVLEQLGFSVERHAARVVLFLQPTEAPRTHMFLVVTLPEGKFVVDPGFGGSGARFPVPLEGSAENATHWIAREGRNIILRFKRDGTDVDGWVSDYEEVNNPIDFEMGNHMTSTHPTSPFRQLIMMSIVTPTGRVSVMNRDITFHDGDDVMPMQLADRRAFRNLLVEHYGFDLPEFDTLRIPAIPEWD
ncbi:MAG TPA: arylamine N-acetyltransferase [Candidatus Baltobacteraceae bacterium]|jgi:N-hydroxyarylamine O-acetyltransferase